MPWRYLIGAAIGIAAAVALILVLTRPRASPPKPPPLIGEEIRPAAVRAAPTPRPLQTPSPQVSSPSPTPTRTPTLEELASGLFGPPTGVPPTRQPEINPDEFVRNLIAAEATRQVQMRGFNVSYDDLTEDRSFFISGLRPTQPLRPTQTEWGIQIDGCHQPIPESLDRVKEVGFLWIKQQVRWGDIESLKDGNRTLDLSCIDAVVAEANARGLKVLLSITTAPVHLRPPYASGSTLGPPRRASDFAEIVRFIVLRYRGQIHAVELWNEPNLSAEWDIGVSPEDYTFLMKAGALAVLASDPNVMVISGGLAPIDSSNRPFYENDVVFLEKIHELGGMLWIDCVGYHANGPDGVGYFHQVLKRYRDAVLLRQDPRLRRPLCLTEVSFSLPYKGQTPPAFSWAMGHTEEMQAQMFDRWIRMSRATNFVRLAIVFNLNYLEGGNVTPNSIAALAREDLKGLTLERFRMYLNP